jgi:hypothetical protein
MKILALDLGKYKTVGCAYESESGVHQFERTFTTPGRSRALGARSKARSRSD